MKVEVKIDQNCKEIEVQITADKINDEVSQLVQRIENQIPTVLTGFNGSEAVLLKWEEITRIYTENNKVIAESEVGNYQLRYRMYECEEKLAQYQFIRISQSELVNLKMIQKFDLSMTGTIRVFLKNKTTTFVSRRYVSKIKKVMGI